MTKEGEEEKARKTKQKTGKKTKYQSRDTYYLIKIVYSLYTHRHKMLSC